MKSLSSFYISLVIIFTSILDSASGLGYGADCSKKTNKSDPCDVSANLRCNGRICECRSPTSYSKQSKRCVIPIGRDCQGDLSNPACPADATCFKTFKMFGEVTPPESILNMLIQAGQDADYRCICDTGLGPDKDKMSCIPIHEPGEICSDKKSECGPKLGMACGPSKTCSCTNNETMIFDPTFEKCATRVGQKCDRQTQCEQNSMCTKVWDGELSKLDALFKTSRSVSGATSGQCECVPGYSQNSANRCVGSHRATCSSKSLCNNEKFLVCVDGKCLCESERIQIFFEVNGSTSCQLLPGSPCSTKKGPPCFQNSVCKSRRCECADDYTKTPSGLCLMNYGGKCDMQGSCNYFQGLACVNSKCDCFDISLKWNPKLKMCTAEDGGLCGKFNPNKGVDFEAERANRTAPLFPVTSATPGPKFYYIGCPEEYSCAKDTLQGGTRCKK